MRHVGAKVRGDRRSTTQARCASPPAARALNEGTPTILSERAPRPRPGFPWDNQDRPTAAAHCGDGAETAASAEPYPATRAATIVDSAGDRRGRMRTAR